MPIQPTVKNAQQSPGTAAVSAPSITLPKGGGAIRGIGEKFAANPITGTGSLEVPIYTSPGRSGFGPQLSLSYDSGAGNGPFGLGWHLSLPNITRKTDKGLPKYADADESDVYILSGAEDLVPVLAGNAWERAPPLTRTLDGIDYQIYQYRPRIEGLFARIERWTRIDSGGVHWRSISKDNVTTLYGRTDKSRITDPDDPSRIFIWLICESYDDKGNAVYYEYKPEDLPGIALSPAQRRNQGGAAGPVNRYLKRIRYGNATPHVPNEDPSQRADWLFDVVFDYGENYGEDAQGQPAFVVCDDSQLPEMQRSWQLREDPFSTYRAGFEIRTYRLCRRVLMFHHFPNELGAQDYLVRATHFAFRESPVASLVTSVSQSGYVRRPDGKYLKKSLPPVEFEYSRVPFEQDEDLDSEVEIVAEVREIDAQYLENLPSGIDGSHYQWVDLDGEGLSGVLTEQANGWFYKRNRGGASPANSDDKATLVPRFADLEPLPIMPTSTNWAGGQQLLDLGGDGQLDLVDLSGPNPGYFERTPDEDWEPFRPFAALPNILWTDPNLRLVDVTGDGLADVLISEDDSFTWFPLLAEDTFGPSERVPQSIDEDDGPHLVFADGTQSIYLADMSGDGLSDLVRIRNGEACYWPNLGYGRFAAKVTMANSPWFDAPDQFDQRRIRLADTDGSGLTDIIYLRPDGVHVYLNRAGNAFSPARILRQCPRLDDVSTVLPVDLLGNGTMCLVWSSPLPGDTARPMRFIDLMGGTKPHLLISVKNNLGAETRIVYAPSTRFYVEDREQGRPWVTKLPFPVHVVERVETYDRVSRNRFVTRYKYHDGYFDGAEREFRGFGMVEQWDTEEFAALNNNAFPAGDNIDAASHVPPAYTKTWFHTGAYLEGARISRHYEEEYYWESDPSAAEPGLNEAQAAAMLLDDTVLPNKIRLPGGGWKATTLSDDETREACRALKGSILHQEIYGLDGTDEEDRPYSASERNYTIELVQPRSGNRHAVFFVYSREIIDFHYERALYEIGGQKLADPRVSHAVTLEADEFGNVLRSAAIGYGRRHRPADETLLDADHDRQEHTLITCTENDYTNPIPRRENDPDKEVPPDPDAYRAPLLCEACTYEILGLVPAPGDAPATLSADQLAQVTQLFRFDSLHTMVEALSDGSHDAAYEDLDASHVTSSPPNRRLIEQTRTLFRSDDLSGLLPLGQLGKLALPGDSYKLAFTPGLIATVYQRDGQPLLSSPTQMLTKGGYAPGDEHKANGLFPAGDPGGFWWAPAGRIYHSPSPLAAPDELAFAREHFFLPHRFEDPFGNATTMAYDHHCLLAAETCDALNNRITVGERDASGVLQKPGHDYRVLQPGLVMDANRNRSAVAFDALGMVVATAVMGKPEESLGDLIPDDLVADLDDASLLAHLDDPLADPTAILGTATTRLLYDVWAYRRSKDTAAPQPSAVYTLARETHHAEPAGASTRIQHSLTYSDGFGREIQKKSQAEPGPVPVRDASGKIVLGLDDQPVLTAYDVSPRWVGSGWTVFNNKGKPVRQYEPFFTDTHRFEFDVCIGVSPVLFYDAIERLVATLQHDHSWSKLAFDPWQQETWDVNDTVLVANPILDSDVGIFFSRLQSADFSPTWHALRTDPAYASAAAARWPDLRTRDAEKRAAEKASVHAATPTIAYFDTLGRPFLTIAHNRFQRPKSGGGTETIEEKLPSRVTLDIEGNPRAVRDAVVQNGDARGRIVMRYDYDMISNRIRQASMEAGERWMLNDVAGKPLYGWDSRGHRFRTTYDPLRRPTDSFLRAGQDAELLVTRTTYGEGYPDPETNNLRGKVVHLFDQAGVVTSNQYDFKGNLLRGSRQLAQAYKATLDWSVQVPLEPETYTSRTRFDALNRPIQSIAPHSDQPGATINVIEPIFNEANLLDQVHAWLGQTVEPAGWLDPASADLHAITNIDYDAKAQRLRADYGNGASTFYTYDPFTFRLTHLLTRRDAAAFPDDCPQPAPADWPGCALQNLHYTYDPSGNVTAIRDDAQQIIFFRNRRVEPSADYTYDALYRLIEATGREHLGQAGGAPIPHSYNDTRRVGIDWSANDGNAMGTYLERYVYDAVGNLVTMQHVGSDPANPGWTRSYACEEASQTEPGKHSNRLSRTTVGTATEIYSSGGDGYDPHGNMLSMPQLESLRWDFKDQLQMTRRQKVDDADDEGSARQGERTCYVYDATGRRVRKLTELANGKLKDERIYLGGFEIHRRHAGAPAGVVRETLHIMDDEQRIALVETRTQGTDPAPQQLIRYQLGNHLGSASLELDDQAEIISHEEYTPFGSTSYQAVRSQTETPKRYRYTGKERDEESGLYYHAARYYAPWLARWTAADPAGLPDGSNPYAYARNTPLLRVDPTGRQSAPSGGLGPYYGQGILYGPYYGQYTYAPSGRNSLFGPYWGRPPDLSYCNIWSNPRSATEQASIWARQREQQALTATRSGMPDPVVPFYHILRLNALNAEQAMRPISAAEKTSPMVQTRTTVPGPWPLSYQLRNPDQNIGVFLAGVVQGSGASSQDTVAAVAYYLPLFAAAGLLKPQDIPGVFKSVSVFPGRLPLSLGVDVFPKDTPIQGDYLGARLELRFSFALTPLHRMAFRPDAAVNLKEPSYKEQTRQALATEYRIDPKGIPDKTIPSELFRLNIGLSIGGALPVGTPPAPSSESGPTIDPRGIPSVTGPSYPAQPARYIGFSMGGIF